MGETVENICSSFVNDKNDNLVPCENPGIDRYDNGLYSGVHCDSCWENLLYTCKQRSW
jgi:hypothetical protein